MARVASTFNADKKQHYSMHTCARSSLALKHVVILTFMKKKKKRGGIMGRWMRQAEVSPSVMIAWRETYSNLRICSKYNKNIQVTPQPIPLAENSPPEGLAI